MYLTKIFNIKRGRNEISGPFPHFYILNNDSIETNH